MWQGFEFSSVDRQLQDAKQGCVWWRFSELRQDADESSLQLAEYLLVGPQKYYSRDAFREVHDWLIPRIQKPSNVLCNSLFHDTRRIDQAIREMRVMNKDPRHDQAMPSSDIGLQQLCRDFVLPGYKDLAGAVYSAFVEPIAITKTAEHGGKPEGMLNNLHAASENVAAAMPATTAAFDSLVRNAIAHGGIEFVGPNIRFTDRASNKSIEVLMGSAIRLFDYAVDVCNALVLAYAVILMANREVLSSLGYSLPDELLIGELIARLGTGAWSVTGCEKAPAIDHQPQLVVKVQETARTQSDFMFNLHKTAAWTQALLPGYARYLIQTSSPVGKPAGLYSFSGPRLDDANNGPRDSPRLYSDTVIPEACLDFGKRHDWPQSIHRLWLMGEAARSQCARAHLLRYSQPQKILLVIRDARATRDHSTIRLWHGRCRHASSRPMISLDL